MPTISVIVPAYNAERTILETITSVLNQTFSDFELIVINDGSTDKTLELLNIVNDPRLKVLSYANGGLSAARNRGTSQATGEFIAFLDIEKTFQSAPPEMQALKNQSLARSYRYIAHMYWTRIGTADAAKQAAQKLWMAIRLYPPILQDRWARNLLFKLLLIRLISPKWGLQLLQSISKFRENRNTKFQKSVT